MATYPGCLVAQCLLALFVQNALSCCGGCGFPTSGGNFAVTSYSPNSPVGIAICSENVYEGALCVQGNLPLLGSAALEGEFGTTGVGEVCYTCGDGDIGIESTGCDASGGSCCNKCGCNNAGCGCINIGSCTCDVGGCCGKAGSCCDNCRCGSINVGSCCCDLGSCCENCRCGSINVGSCCCDLGSCCNNCGCGCTNSGSCCGCGCTNSGSCCGKCACDKCISLNIHPDCCFNINPMWTVDPSSICICPCSGFNIDNVPSSCCQCSNAGFNIDNVPSSCCQCSNAGFNIDNGLDCCKCQDCCQFSGNSFSSNSNFGSGNGFSNSNSFALLKRFGLSGCWYPSNMYSSPFGRRLHELLHGNDCDCGCNCGCSGFGFGGGYGCCSC